MQDTLVSFPGCDVPTKQQEPAANVVERLEELLAKAKSGQLRGIAYAIVELGNKRRYAWVYDAQYTTVDGLSSGILGLGHMWCADCSGEEK